MIGLSITLWLLSLLEGPSVTVFDIDTWLLPLLLEEETCVIQIEYSFENTKKNSEELEKMKEKIRVIVSSFGGTITHIDTSRHHIVKPHKATGVYLKDYKSIKEIDSPLH